MKPYFVLIISVLFYSCTKTICDPERTLCTWSEGKEIDVSFDTTYMRNRYTVIDGENLLFQYNHAGPQCDNVIDDEWGENLYFEIDKNLDEFKYVDSGILETNCFYHEYGAWVSYIQRPVKDGTLEGKKISMNQWKVTADVKTTPVFPVNEVKTIKFSKTFEK